MANRRTAVSATAGELDRLGRALGAAFEDDPVQQWLFADAPDPAAAIGRFLRFFVDEYFALGHTYRLDGDAGADEGGALWAPPGRDVLKGRRIDDLLALVRSEIGDATEARLTELARAAAHRPEERHFYLGVLGVVPAVQGRGLGAVLVEEILDRCDRAGLVAHLESSNPRNLGFYEPLGFAVVTEFRCGGGPLMTVMTCRPR